MKQGTLCVPVCASRILAESRHFAFNSPRDCPGRNLRQPLSFPPRLGCRDCVSYARRGRNVHPSRLWRKEPADSRNCSGGTGRASSICSRTGPSMSDSLAAGHWGRHRRTSRCIVGQNRCGTRRGHDADAAYGRQFKPGRAPVGRTGGHLSACAPSDTIIDRDAEKPRRGGRQRF
jgi:hypothetical protein